MALTPKQQRFIEEYLVDLNGTQAAIRAGYSKKTANPQAARLLANVSISAAIDAARKALSERTEITQDAVLKELAAIGFADMGDYVRLDPDGRAYVDWSRLPHGGTKAVSEVTQEVVVKSGDDTPDEILKTKFKLHDKRAALVDIGKHLGMFVNRHEHAGPDGGPIEVGEATPLEVVRRVAFLLAQGVKLQASDKGPTNG